MKINLRSLLFRGWYWYVNKIDKNGDILFMNYGYENPDEKIALEPQDETNRYSIQLYHRLANAVSLENKDIVEIGCGRGGGLEYITRRFSPAGALGIDLDKSAAQFGNKHYSIDKLRFMQGDAQELKLDNNSFDIVVNVESSHRYPEMRRFLTEVNRILRPGGYFLFTDFRYDYEISELQNDLDSIGFEILDKQEINKYVVASLDCDTPRRKQLVEKLAPKFLHKTALNFAGATGSETYNRFKNGEYVYFLYIFQKR